jgi:hypothetical protein
MGKPRFLLAATLFAAACLPARADDVAPLPDGTPAPHAAPAFRPGGGRPREPRFQYTLDGAMSLALGNSGTNGVLPGTVDAVASYALGPTWRIQGGHYEFPITPSGIQTGFVPVYAGPRTLFQSDLSRNGPDIRVKNLIDVFSVAKTLLVGRYPIIVAGAYIARSGRIPYAGGGDVVTVVVDGTPQAIHLRSTQLRALATTFPLYRHGKATAALTETVTQLVNVTGNNASNGPQIGSQLLLQWDPSPREQLYAIPTASRDYLPPYPYPEHLNAIRYGWAYTFAPHVFIQIAGGLGSSANAGRFGIASLNCYGRGCPGPANPPVPQLGGLHTSTLQFKLGIGQPAIAPF